MYVHNGIDSRIKLQNHHAPLNLLSEAQCLHAGEYLLGTLPAVVQHIPLGEAANLGAWFNELDLEQQDQVVAFYQKELLDDNGLTLTRYDGHGQEDGQYRFELAFPHPVTSR